MSDRFTADTITDDALDALYERAEQAEATIERVRAAVHIADDDDVTDWQRGYRACSNTARTALGDDVPNPLVVERYRNDRQEIVWCFRCWGTDDCDGWLSLDHHSRQSAERARDRHVADEHAGHASPKEES